MLALKDTVKSMDARADCCISSAFVLPYFGCAFMQNAALSVIEIATSPH